MFPNQNLHELKDILALITHVNIIVLATTFLFSRIKLRGRVVITPAL